MSSTPNMTPLASTAAGTSAHRASRLIAVGVAAAVLGASLTAGIVRPATSASASSAPSPIEAWISATFTRIDDAAVRASESSGAVRDDWLADKLQPRPRSGPFGMNLYRQGDFVSQHTEYWCVAASVQTMMNIIEPGKPDRSRATQRSLQFQARRMDRSDDDYWRARMSGERWRKGHHGLGLTDWVGLLNANGSGPYEIDRANKLHLAIRKAARAIRLTGKPAGLVVWRGAHAWVMSGFEATADPAYTNDYKVKRVYIQDPWYPAVSTIWGASRPPNANVPVRALDEDFLRYDRPGRRHPKRDGKYMLILPTVPTAAG